MHNIPTLSIALKEWHLVICDFLAGRQAILLRKGGILEAENQFVLEHNHFLLYPTFIHQDPRMVKPQRRPDIQLLPAEPRQIEIQGHAQLVQIFEVPSRQQLEQLSDLHPWDASFLDMRFNYRPEKPLYLVLLKAFRLQTPITIPNTIEYAGCKSWVPLLNPIDVSNSTPALGDDQLRSLQTRIQTTFNLPPSDH
jgi:hypothetical protein